MHDDDVLVLMKGGGVCIFVRGEQGEKNGKTNFREFLSVVIAFGSVRVLPGD